MTTTQALAMVYKKITGKDSAKISIGGILGCLADDLPQVPTKTGKYNLVATVSGKNIKYTWEKITQKDS